MNRNLKLLAAGALTALALAVLPALASAEEYEAHCEGAAVCTGEITSAAISLRDDGGNVITCTLGGTTNFPTGTTTATATLHLTECREHVTFFTFKCNSPGAAAGTITTANLIYHFINLEHGGTTPGVKFTNISLTFECTGFSKKTVTGSLVGLIETASCNTAVTTHDFFFDESGTGIQKYMQLTTTGTKTDLIVSNDAGGAYTTAAIHTTWTVHWDHPAKITC